MVYLMMWDFCYVSVGVVELPVPTDQYLVYSGTTK